jgi:hypothetical protein
MEHRNSRLPPVTEPSIPETELSDSETLVSDKQEHSENVQYIQTTLCDSHYSELLSIVTSSHNRLLSRRATTDLENINQLTSVSFIAENTAAPRQISPLRLDTLISTRISNSNSVHTSAMTFMPCTPVATTCNYVTSAYPDSFNRSPCQSSTTGHTTVAFKLTELPERASNATRTVGLTLPVMIIFDLPGHCIFTNQRN